MNIGELTGSAHGKLVCVDCHLDVIELPHSKRLKKVTALACHSKGKTFEQGPTIEYLTVSVTASMPGSGRKATRKRPIAPPAMEVTIC